MIKGRIFHINVLPFHTHYPLWILFFASFLTHDLWRKLFYTMCNLNFVWIQSIINGRNFCYDHITICIGAKAQSIQKCTSAILNQKWSVVECFINVQKAFYMEALSKSVLFNGTYIFLFWNWCTIYQWMIDCRFFLIVPPIFGTHTWSKAVFLHTVEFLLERMHNLRGKLHLWMVTSNFFEPMYDHHILLKWITGMEATK